MNININIGIFQLHVQAYVWGLVYKHNKSMHYEFLCNVVDLRKCVCQCVCGNWLDSTHICFQIESGEVSY